MLEIHFPLSSPTTHTHIPSDSWLGRQISLTNTLTLQVRHSESKYHAWFSIIPFFYPPLHGTSPTIPTGPFLKTTKYTPCSHSHSYMHRQIQTTEVEAWWSHTNKAATRNTWCCDSTSSLTAGDIKHGHTPDNPIVMWVNHKSRPVYIFFWIQA